ncbi:lysostaphin resistance A-like protein [Labrys portucalensis]|uniref:Lysostaphin resistance A-like protein n=1 Tax=Labrys neptuniae TaxID=376174 RepID=A0ABV6ZQQ8_9HYPH
MPLGPEPTLVNIIRINTSFSAYISAIVTLLYFSIIVPLAEELAWRGFIFGKLSSLGLSNGRILVTVSIMFALSHLPRDMGILFPISLLPFSFCVTWIRLKSQNLLLPTLLHASANGIPLIFPISSWIRHLLYG